MDVYNSKGGVEEDEHGYDNLCKYSIEKCELCDMVFSSRFANIIHCSQHIIIPLIKQKVHQCKKCMHCFTSKSDLKTHKQTKHKNKDVNTANNGQAEHVIDREESLIGHEGSPVGEVSLIGQEATQGHKQSQVAINHKKSPIDKRKRKNSHVDESQSHISHIDESQSVNETENENEKNALLKSLITKQPIVQIEDIGNVVAKLTTNNNKTHTKPQKETTITEKDKDKTQKVKKNIEKVENKILNYKKDDVNRSLNDKKVKDREMMFSRTELAQDIIPEGLSNKVIIGKRKSAEKTDNDNKKQKKSYSKDATTVGDKTSKTTITNGVHTVEITGDSKRHSSNIREISPDIISLDSDSSDEPLSKSATVSKNIMPTASQSVRKYLQFSFEDIVKDQPKAAQQNGQSKNVQQKTPIKAQQKDLSENMHQNDWPKNTQQKDSSKNTPQKEQSKNLQQKEQTKNLQQKDWSKNAQKKDQSKNTPFLLTEFKNEAELNLDKLLQSPVKKTNFRSKLQFEDDETEEELFEKPLVLKKKVVKPLPIEALDMELADLSYKFKSVHYDELVEPELSECQRCHMIFMNRLALHKHETSHIRIRRPRKHYFCRYCESYYVGNHFTQKKHFDTVHNITADKRARYSSCPVCKLQYYKLKRHYEKYHQSLICKQCSTCFQNEQVLTEHDCRKTATLKVLPERRNPQEKVSLDAKNSLVSVFSDNENAQKQYDLLLVCELCLSFIKITGKCTYEVVGEKSELGVRQNCFYCTKKFFAVKIVKRVTVGALVAKVKIQNVKQAWKCESKKVSQGSNALKLQSIQKRLKAMKQ